MRSDLTNVFEHNYGDIKLYQWCSVVLKFPDHTCEKEARKHGVELLKNKLF